VAKKGAKRPIFEGNMPPKKCIPKIGANIGAITGILLTNLVGIEVVFLILLVVLSIAGSRMLKISFKPRTGSWTGSWGLILGRNASFLVIFH
jgi:hypothetical protein